MNTKNEYYLVNDRPVKFVILSDGGMDVLAFDFETGEFQREMHYLSEIHKPFKDVDRLDETAFNAYVEHLLVTYGLQKKSDDNVRPLRTSISVCV